MFVQINNCLWSISSKFIIIRGVPIFVDLGDSISTHEIKNSRNISHNFSLFFDLPTEIGTVQTGQRRPPPLRILYAYTYIAYCRGYTNFGIHENTMFLQPTKIGIQQFK